METSNFIIFFVIIYLCIILPQRNAMRLRRVRAAKKRRKKEDTMKKKDWYEAPNMEIILYSNDDVIRTSNIGSEVGDGWDNEGWGE